MHTLDSIRDTIATKRNLAANLQQRIAEAQTATTEAHDIGNELKRAKNARRGLLGRLFLGERVNTTNADAEVAELEAKAAAVADHAEGADAAREILQTELEAVGRDIIELQSQVPALVHQTGLAELEALNAEFIEAARVMANAYVKAAGMARALDAIKTTQPFTCDLRDGNAFDLPAPARHGLKEWQRRFDLTPAVLEHQQQAAAKLAAL